MLNLALVAELSDEMRRHCCQRRGIPTALAAQIAQIHYRDAGRCL